MSGNILTTTRALDDTIASELGQSHFIAITIGGETKPWSPFNAGLQKSLQARGYNQPNEVIEGKEQSADRWKIIAPGIIVRSSEFDARYGFLDLPSLRQRMTPQIFRAFVRHIGAIEGPERVDVNELLKGYEN